MAQSVVRSGSLYRPKAWWHGSVGRAHRSHRRGKREKRQPGELSCEAGSESSLLARKEERSPPQGLRATIERTDVGSSPTVTTTNPVGVQVQRLPDFFAYPSRVRTFRSQEYALFCQRGTQKGYADHLKTAYPCRRLVHINQ